ncbi:DUF5681 domain-containing protein [Aquisediminimonas sediminicola]|uniref:DUF5681 domain-containing protein n=1 Tax=Alteraquisediminimonas sediminicola TaxID=2676787 RepID=UPI001C8D194B|nr:DUF5681 domain-containing protein [Aquisediminimonas sediminicola]
MTISGHDGPPENDGSENIEGEAAPYEVGYGKPPKHTQFPKGNGPGKGRPKGAKNIKTLVNEAFSVKVPAKINGKTKNISKIGLALHQLANQASSGNFKAIAKLIELHERYGPVATDDSASDAQAPVSTKDLIHFLKMQGDIPYTDDGEHDDV